MLLLSAAHQNKKSNKALIYQNGQLNDKQVSENV